MTNTLDTFTLAADLQDADLMHLKRGTGVNSDKRVTGATIKAIFATAAQGALADTALQPADVGTAAAEDVGYFATAAQGALADTALQSGANISVLTNDLGFTDDQTDAEIETAYNNQVAAASQVEMEAGVETAIRRMSPLRVAQAINALAAGGLTWSSANSSIPVLAGTGTIFYNLVATVTATLPASPSVGDAVWIHNNDDDPADAYNVIITAGASNVISEQNINYIPQVALSQGQAAQLVCFDAGATKQWHIKRFLEAFATPEIEGTEILSTGEVGGTKFLREDGDGTCSWQTVAGGTGGVAASFKTGAYTAAAGDIVGVGSDTAAITITLPATPNTDDYVGVWDADDNAGTNHITVARNGETIDGSATDFIINVNGGRVDLIYNGTTWKVAYTTPGASGFTEFTGSKKRYFSQMEMYPPSTAKCGALTLDTDPLSSGRAIKYFPFDALSTERVCFDWAIPEHMDQSQGILGYTVYWVAPTTNTGNVLWELRAAGFSDGESFSGYHGGTSASVLDAGQGTIDLLHKAVCTTALSTAEITSAAAGYYLQFVLLRLASDASDTYTGDAWLLGVEIEYATDAPTDD